MGGRIGKSLAGLFGLFYKDTQKKIYIIMRAAADADAADEAPPPAPTPASAATSARSAASAASPLLDEEARRKVEKPMVGSERAAELALELWGLHVAEGSFKELDSIDDRIFYFRTAHRSLREVCTSADANVDADGATRHYVQNKEKKTKNFSPFHVLRIWQNSRFMSFFRFCVSRRRRALRIAHGSAHVTRRRSTAWRRA